LKDHNLLQAICRVNRTCGQSKTYGHLGIFDDVARALDFDEQAVQEVASKKTGQPRGRETRAGNS